MSNRVVEFCLSTDICACFSTIYVRVIEVIMCFASVFTVYWLLLTSFGLCSLLWYRSINTRVNIYTGTWRTWSLQVCKSRYFCCVLMRSVACVFVTCVAYVVHWSICCFVWIELKCNWCRRLFVCVMIPISVSIGMWYLVNVIDDDWGWCLLDILLVFVITRCISALLIVYFACFVLCVNVVRCVYALLRLVLLCLSECLGHRTWFVLMSRSEMISLFVNVRLCSSWTMLWFRCVDWCTVMRPLSLGARRCELVDEEFIHILKV